jgi:cobalamin synthase
VCAGGDGQGLLLAGIGTWTLVAGLVLGVLLTLPAGTAGLSAVAGAAIAAVALGVVARRGFGGVTGDVLGATAKVAETGALLGAVAVLD